MNTMSDEEIEKRIAEVRARAPIDFIAQRAIDAIEALEFRGRNARDLKRLIGMIGRSKWPLLPDPEFGQDVAFIARVIDDYRERNQRLTPRQVVGAIIRTPDGETLIGQRREDQWQPGKWCFPGGKVEFGESHRDAVKRELKEELDLDVDVGELIHQQLVAWENGTFELNYFKVMFCAGQVAKPIAFQRIASVPDEELIHYDLLKVDIDIAVRLREESIRRRFDAETNRLEELLVLALEWIEDKRPFSPADVEERAKFLKQAHETLGR